MKYLLLLTFFISTRLFAQQTTDKCPWSDTNYISVKLHDLRKDEKIVIVDIGQKATIYLEAKKIRQSAVIESNDFNKEELSTIINLIDSASLKSDTIIIDQYLPYFNYLVSKQLQKGNAKVFYKKLNSFVPTVSHRLEKYGMYAHRFFYLPDKRPFFSTMEMSGIIEDNKFFSDPDELEKLGDKLSGLGKE